MNDTNTTLEDWIDKASRGRLKETAYKELLELLPEDPEERRHWIDELRVAMGLQALNEKADEAWLREQLVKQSQQPRFFSSILLKAAAMSMLGLGLTALLLSLLTAPMGSDVEEGEVTVIVAKEDLNDFDEPMAPLPTSSLTVETLEFDAVHEVHPLESEVVSKPVGEELVVASTGDPSVQPPPPVDGVQDVSNLAVLGSTGGASGASELVSGYTIRTPSAVAGVRGTEATVDKGFLERKESPRLLARDGMDVLTKSKREATDARRAPLRSSPPVTALAEMPQAPASPSGERYEAVLANDFVRTEQDAKSTFSIDVDTASYSNVRRMIRDGQRPDPHSVRIEEMINNFRYNYPQPGGEAPFSVTLDQARAPWNPEHRLVRIGLKGRVDAQRPVANLVFLLDVSGSMNSSLKLPLLKRSFGLLLNALDDRDQISIVAYAGHTGVVLDPTPASDREKIMKAITRLRSSGGTNGAGGIQLAYDLAARSFVEGGVNRVILATDGDFNVGISNRDALQNFIEEKRKTGVELSVLGFGTGNIRDDIMERLANKGNGNYTYIDSIRQARKALVEEMESNLVTIAKDVKIQVEFNPETVESFRLIGYENRKLAHRDFADDRKDAGEIGMGHSVTALYEVVPRSTEGKVLTLNLRHKEPGQDVSRLQSYDLVADGELRPLEGDFLWATAVATWGQMLRGEAHVAKVKPADLIEMARQSKGRDAHGYRAEMIQLMETWFDLRGKGQSDDLPRWEYRR